MRLLKWALEGFGTGYRGAAAPSFTARRALASWRCADQSGVWAGCGKGEPVGEPESTLHLRQQYHPAVPGDASAIECSAHPFACYHWQIKGQKALLAHGAGQVGIFRASVTETRTYSPIRSDEETRSLMIEAAMHEFQANGYAATCMKQRGARATRAHTS
jgi:hypothetical protein